MDYENTKIIFKTDISLDTIKLIDYALVLKSDPVVLFHFVDSQEYLFANTPVTAKDDGLNMDEWVRVDDESLLRAYISMHREYIVLAMDYYYKKRMELEDQDQMDMCTKIIDNLGNSYYIALSKDKESAYEAMHKSIQGLLFNPKEV